MSYTNHDITVFVFCSGAASDPTRTLDGLLVQTVAPGRVVIVDNGIEPALALDPFFSARTGASLALVRTPSVLSEGRLRNFALDMCSSPLAMGIDADLIPAPDWVELMLAAFAPKCQCMAPNGRIAAIGGRVSWLLPTEHPGEDAGFDQGIASSTDPDFIWLGNALFSIDLLRQVQGFNPDLTGVDLGRDVIRRIRQSGGAVLYYPEIRCGKI